MTTNLFDDIGAPRDVERIDVLLVTEALRLERIVSTGHATRPGEWYEQTRAEWVLVLRGSAGLRFEGEADLRTLSTGDHLLIPARCRHRVEWTDTREPTVWLALHF